MSLFSEGMFMDGLLYAAISNNMANGLGTFWQPYLSDSVFPEFYEHPPLALGLQSIWFWLFGDSLLVERFYSLFTYLLTGIGLVGIWVQLGKSIKTGWIPLFFWLMVSNIIWAVSNNMLENTMAVFVIFAAWCYLKAINKNKLFFLVAAGFLLSLGFLSKGFVCLYIWALPLGIFVITKKINFQETLIHTLVIVASTILPLLAIFLFWEEANNNLSSYFNNQVLGSIKNVTNVNSRFAIIWEFAQHIVAPVAIAFLVFMLTRKNKSKSTEKNPVQIKLLTFILMCGILPIMVSMKQRGFYILTVYPFFGLLIGFIVLPWAENKVENWQHNARIKKTIALFSVLLAGTSIIFSSFQAGTIQRDSEEVADCKMVVEYIGTYKSIDICHSQYGDWSKHGYYARYGNITLMRMDEKKQDWFLVNKNECSPDFDLYEETPLKLTKHKLFRKK